ncbi:hypothetical protein WDU94_003628, partial [Cyamophila willieti]
MIPSGLDAKSVFYNPLKIPENPIMGSRPKSKMAAKKLQNYENVRKTPYNYTTIPSNTNKSKKSNNSHGGGNKGRISNGNRISDSNDCTGVGAVGGGGVGCGGFSAGGGSGVGADDGGACVVGTGDVGVGGVGTGGVSACGVGAGDGAGDFDSFGVGAFGDDSGSVGAGGDIDAFGVGAGDIGAGSGSVGAGDIVAFGVGAGDVGVFGVCSGGVGAVGVGAGGVGAGGLGACGVGVGAGVADAVGVGAVGGCSGDYGEGGDIRNDSNFISNQDMEVLDKTEKFSDFEVVKRGVPQGSILGPILFVLYINDMPHIINALSVFFADDTSIIVKNKALQDVKNQLGIIINDLMLWLNTNNLIPNINKTNLVKFTTNYEKHEDPLNIMHNEQSIPQTQTIRFLGVQVDEKLNWKKHIELLRTKLRRLNFALRVITRTA